MNLLNRADTVMGHLGGLRCVSVEWPYFGIACHIIAMNNHPERLGFLNGPNQATVLVVMQKSIYSLAGSAPDCWASCFLST